MQTTRTSFRIIVGGYSDAKQLTLQRALLIIVKVSQRGEMRIFFENELAIISVTENNEFACYKFEEILLFPTTTERSRSELEWGTQNYRLLLYRRTKLRITNVVSYAIQTCSAISRQPVNTSCESQQLESFQISQFSLDGA